MVSRFFAASLIYLVFACVFIMGPPCWGPDSSFGSLIDKHARLKALPGQKIVLIGGSNVSMGTDSAQIQKELKRPVINMGLSITLGLKYMLAEVKETVKSGDLYVIIPEYQYFCKSESADYLDGTSALIQLAQAYPGSLRWMAPNYAAHPLILIDRIRQLIVDKRKAYLKAGKTYIAEHGKTPILTLLQPTHTILSHRESFNAYGDCYTHLGLPSPGYGEDVSSFLGYPLGYDKRAQNAISNFTRYATSRGATVVIIPPPWPAPLYSLTHRVTNDIFKKLSADSNLKVLAQPKRYTFAKTDFYDSPYHLNEQGRRHRTDKIIEDLHHFYDQRDTSGSIKTI